MPKFNYIANTATGETQRGEMEAPSKPELAKKLKTKGLFLVSCRSENDQPGPAAPPKMALRPSTPEPLKLSGRQDNSQRAAPASAPSGAAQSWVTNLFHP